MAKYIQDFKEGETYESPGRTITETDVVQFTGLSWDTNPIHTDEAFCAKGPFGKRIAHGALTFSVATGLAGRSGWTDGTAIAFLEIENWKFHGPVMIGDTLRVRVTVTGAKLSASKPDRGVLKRRLEVLNQRDEVVQSGIFVAMMKARVQ